MIIIYTGNHEIDKILEEEIKGSMVVSYSDFIIEDNKFENQTVIISASAIERDLREYLYRLRSLNIRVIVIFKNEKQESDLIKITLETGIYDLIFGNFYPSELKNIIDKPRTFKDVSKMYKKVFDIKIKKIKKRKWKEYLWNRKN